MYCCTSELNLYELKNICVFNDMPITKILLSNINVKLSILYPGFHIKVLGVYTHSTETIYLSLRAQEAVGTYFMESPLPGCSGIDS